MIMRLALMQFHKKAFGAQNVVVYLITSGTMNTEHVSAAQLAMGSTSKNNKIRFVILIIIALTSWPIRT